MKAALAVLLAILTGCAHEATPPFVRPKAILLIRHAEKPADAADIHLGPEGKKRAHALPDLFKKSDTRPDPFPTPDFIIATKASKHSNRPVETVTPLAQALKLEVDATCANDDYPDLTEKLYTTPKYEGKVVLICWHHGNLPEFATMLGATGVPDKWKDPVFDRVWVVTFGEKGKNTPLTNRPQALMPGDAKE
jgi:hypothetical protein